MVINDKIVLATTNPHKARMLSWITKPYFRSVVPQNPALDLATTGSTLAERAQNKAAAASTLYRSYAIATAGDAVLPSLGDNWYQQLADLLATKQDPTDFDKLDGLLELLKDATDRTVHWQEALALAYNGQLLFTTEAQATPAEIQTSYTSEGHVPGLWIRSATCYPQFNGKNFYQLDEEERQQAEDSWHHLRTNFVSFISRNRGQKP